MIQKTNRGLESRTIEVYGGFLLFTSEFIVPFAPLLAIAGRIALILAMAFVLNRVQKRLIARAIQAAIPTAKHEHGDNSNVRSQMITAVIIKVLGQNTKNWCDLTFHWKRHNFKFSFT